MQSALECLQRAAECERLAATTESDTAYHVMKAAAAQWRNTAEEIASHAPADLEGRRMDTPRPGMYR